MSVLCSFLSFSHKSCKNKIRQLIQAGLDDERKIKSLDTQVMQLVNQVHELKAINDYQTFMLERKIIDLENELSEFKCPED